ncbi:MAG: hypothetical protein MK195_05600 [Acidimicrobiales bacterium]|nr:hypothetical protein [Acidimicrobiales bacterium]
MSEEEENNEDENPADFEEEEFPEDIEEEEDLEDAPLDDDDDDEEEDDEDDESGPVAVSDSNDDDDDDPADVEADLDAILKDRIASGEDDDGDEEQKSAPTKKEAPVQSDEESVEARRKGEVTCPSCFLIIESQIAKDTGECPHCGGSV